MKENTELMRREHSQETRVSMLLYIDLLQVPVAQYLSLLPHSNEDSILSILYASMTPKGCDMICQQCNKE